MLSRPDSELVVWLHKIAGIVCLSGGIASHLALIALEAEIPYLVAGEDVQPLANGQQVTIDPVSGLISLDRP